MGQEDAKKEEPEPSHYSVLKEAALMVLLLATCANFIGFVATAWVVPVDEESHQHFEGLGLWQFCSFHIEENEALCEKTTSLDMPQWFTIAQALMATGFTLLFIAMVIVIASECIRRCQLNMKLVYLALVVTFCASTLNTLGVSAFAWGMKEGDPLSLPGEGDNAKYTTSWGFTVCTASAGCTTLSWLLLIVEIVRNKRNNLQQRKTAPSPEPPKKNGSIIEGSTPAVEEPAANGSIQGSVPSTVATSKKGSSTAKQQNGGATTAVHFMADSVRKGKTSEESPV